jgi:hypothetical protein
MGEPRVATVCKTKHLMIKAASVNHSQGEQDDLISGFDDFRRCGKGRLGFPARFHMDAVSEQQFRHLLHHVTIVDPEADVLVFWFRDG